MKRKLFLVVFAIALLISFASAETYYVDATGGSDANNGLAAENESPGVGPFKTIQKALGLDDDGDVIVIMAANSPGYTAAHEGTAALNIDKSITLYVNEASGSVQDALIGAGVTLTISVPNGTVSLGDGGTGYLQIAGTIALTDGTVDLTGANVVLANDALINRTEGTVDEAFTIATNGKVDVTYTSTGAYNIVSGPELPATIDDLIIDGAAGSVTISDALTVDTFSKTLGGAVYFNDDLTLKDDNFDPADGDVTVSGTLTLAAGDDIDNDSDDDITLNRVVLTDAAGDAALIDNDGADLTIDNASFTVKNTDVYIDNATGGGDLTFQNDVTFNVASNGGSDNDTWVVTIENDNNGDVTFNGAIVGSGTTLADSKDATKTETLVIDLENDGVSNANGTMTFSDVTARNLTNQGAATSPDAMVFSGATTITGDVDIDAGDVAFNENATIYGEIDYEGVNIIVASGKTLTVIDATDDGAAQAHDFNEAKISGDGTVVFDVTAPGGSEGHALTNVCEVPDLQIDAPTTLDDGTAGLDVDGNVVINDDFTTTLDGAAASIDGNVTINSGADFQNIGGFKLTVSGGITLNSGTLDIDDEITTTNFTMVDGAVDVNALVVFELNNGSFTRIAGDWTHNNTSVLEFSGTTSTTFDPGPNLEIADLVINKVSGVSVGSLTIVNDVQLAGDLTVNADNIVDIAGNYIDLITASTSSTFGNNAQLLVETSGGLRFRADEQEIIGDEYSNIVIDAGSANAVYISDAANNNVTFTGTLYLASGELQVRDQTGSDADISPKGSDAKVAVNPESSSGVTFDGTGGGGNCTFNADGVAYDLEYVGALSGNDDAIGGELTSDVVDVIVSTSGSELDFPDSDITVKGNLTVNSGAILEMQSSGARAHTVKGNLTVAGTIRNDGAGVEAVEIVCDADDATHSIVGTVEGDGSTGVVGVTIAGTDVTVTGSDDDDKAATVETLVIAANASATVTNVQIISGAVYVENNGTLSLGLFDGGNANEGEVAGTITVEAGGNALTLTSDVIANGDITINAGSFDIGENDLTIAADGATLTLNANASYSGTGTVIFGDAKADGLNLDANGVAITNAQLVGNLTLASNAEISGMLDADNDIDCGTKTLELSGDATLYDDDNGDGVQLTNGTLEITGTSTVTAEDDAAFQNLTINSDGVVTLETNDNDSNPTARTFKVDGGTFTHTKGEVNVAINTLELDDAAYAYANGTYAETSGKVKFTCDGGNITFNSSNKTVSMYNVEVEDGGNGHDVVLSADDVLNITGTLTLSDGQIDASASDAMVTFADGTTLVREDGTFVEAPSFGLDMNISYTTALDANQDTDIELPTTFNTLTINHAGANNDDIVLKKDIVVNNLVLVDGELDQGTKSITIAADGSITQKGGAFKGTQTPSVSTYSLIYSGGGAVNTSGEFQSDAGESITSMTITGNTDVTLTGNGTVAALAIEPDANGNKSTLELGTKSLTLTGDLDVTGGIIGGAGGALIFAGSEAQTWTTSHDMAIGGDITVDNASGVTIASTASRTLTFAGCDLNLNEGALVTGDNIVHLDQGNDGASPTQGFTRINGYVLGYVRKTVMGNDATTNVDEIQNSNIEFPVGDKGQEGEVTDLYRPATFYFPSNPNTQINLTVQHVNTRPDGDNGYPISSDVGELTNYTDFYWEIKSSITLSPSTLFDLSLAGDGYTDFPETNVENIRVVRRFGQSSANEWRLQGADQYDNYEAADGSPTVTLRDATGGLSTQGAYFTYGQISQAPMFTSAPAKFDVNENEEMVLGYKAHDVDIEDVATIALISDLPSFATIETVGDDSATVTLAPSYTDAGEYSYAFRASDGSSTLDTTITFNVVNVNMPVAFASVPADTMLVENTAYEFSYTVEDVDEDDVTTFAIVEAISDDAAITSEGVVTFTTGAGTEDGLKDTLIVSATDNVGETPAIAYDTLLVTIVKPVAPVWGDVLADTYVRSNDTLVFTYTATDGNAAAGDVVKFSLQEEVEGASIDATTGEFEFIPTDDMINSTFDIVIVATDASANAIISTVKVTVKSNILGDVDLSGKLQAFDASLVLQHAVKKITLTGDSLALADVTGKGGVGALDASYIFMKTLNPDTTLEGWDSDYGTLTKSAAAGDIEWSVVADEENKSLVIVPLTLANASNVYSFEFAAEVDPSNVTIDNVVMSLPEGWQTAKYIEDGVLRVAACGVTPIESSTIGNIELEVINELAVSEMNGSIVLNENNSRDMETLAVRQVPTEFKLSQNYPNPFNPTTNIAFQIPEANKVVINIYDMLGNKVSTLVNENRAAGYHMVQWNGLNNNGARMASGTYFYHIQAGSYNSTKKMLLIK